MSVFRKEFYRKRTPKGNFLVCYFVIDTDGGTFRVLQERTAKSGETISVPPALFMAGKSQGFDRVAQRVCRSKVRSAFSEPGWEEV